METKCLQFICLEFNYFLAFFHAWKYTFKVVEELVKLAFALRSSFEFVLLPYHLR